MQEASRGEQEQEESGAQNGALSEHSTRTHQGGEDEEDRNDKKKSSGKQSRYGNETR